MKFLVPAVLALAVSSGLRADLGLPDLVRTALERNLDLQSARLAAEASLGDLVAARGAFDPEAHLATSWSRNHYDFSFPTGVGNFGEFGTDGVFLPGVSGFSQFINWNALNLLPKEALSGTQGYDERQAGISGKTPWSTEYNVGWVSRRSLEDPINYQFFPVEWDSTLKAGVRQPLLRGRGAGIASAPVSRAELALSAAQARALEEADQVAAAVERAYAAFELADADEQIAGIALERARTAWQKNKEQNELGLRAGIDLVAAERRYVDRQAALVAARQVRRDTQEALLALAYGSGASAAFASGEELRSQAGDSLGAFPDLPPLESCESLALERRKILQAAHKDLGALQVDVRVARDALKPALDLTGSYAWQGLDNQAEGLRAGSRAWSTGLRGWTVGLELTVPLPGRAARGAVQRAAANVREQELALQGLEVQVRTQVRAAFRAVQATRERLGIEARLRELSEAHFKGETERFDLGLTTFFTLQQVEEELDQSELLEAQARFEAELAVSAIREAMGESAGTYLR